MTTKHAAAGFSLVEVLVALVVLSIGMIGIAAMQVEGLRFGQQAVIGTRAIGLAADMAERIRANPNARLVPTSGTAGDAYATDTGGVGAPNPLCADTATSSIDAAGVCNPLQLANFDVWQWKTALQGAGGSGLPQGDGEIVYSSDKGVATYEINVIWSERGAERNYQLVVRQ
jgi:type IV pilus assembly protein PilV